MDRRRRGRVPKNATIGPWEFESLFGSRNKRKHLLYDLELQWKRILDGSHQGACLQDRFFYHDGNDQEYYRGEENLELIVKKVDFWLCWLFWETLFYCNGFLGKLAFFVMIFGKLAFIAMIFWKLAFIALIFLKTRFCRFNFLTFKSKHAFKKLIRQKRDSKKKLLRLKSTFFCGSHKNHF